MPDSSLRSLLISGPDHSKIKARPQPGSKAFVLRTFPDYCVLTQPDVAFDHSY
jgi:hypothetical protein